MKIMVAIKQVPERDARGEMDGTAPQLLDVAQLIARNLHASTSTAVSP